MAFDSAKLDELQGEATEGTPLILFPGYLETAAIWRPFLDRHRDLAVPIRILPLPGHDPDGGAPPIARLEGNAFVEDHARSLRRAYPGRRLQLLGHSTGGLVALELARRHPDMVESILLTGPLCSGRLRRFDTRPVRLLLGHGGRALARLLHRTALANAGLFQVFCASVQADRAHAAAVPDAMRRELARCDPEALRAVLLWLTRQCLLDGLHEVRTPVQGIIGRRDPVVHPAHQIALLRRLPNARAMLVDAGHLPFLEAPEPFDRCFSYWMYHDRLLRRQAARSGRPEGLSGNGSVEAGI